MVERATLKLDSGDEVRVEVDRDDLEREEIVVRRTARAHRPASRNLLEVVDELLVDAKPHPAGTTDRLLAGDRRRSF